ncbi:epsin-3 isoform X2 [Latimeria chalumnae]|uniref:epsin-3 isoform X2 n=1 Tax=Latimeria chalumnae TaxID=7897 RepID=UPI0003C1321A|nr:PREDICTED: epsin-3 isoform X2 [Latimeria chalumnae]|eukprot:XP_005999657.1 PREDICTED: epsin-3 isoform X2 [Latimeria chalumnae]
MTTSALRRQVKNIVHNYSEAEIKVREATSNDPWGPPSSLMSEIADLTFNVVAFTEVMGMIWKRLNDHGKNWRHVYKALTLLDYLIKTGSEKVAQQCKENIYAIQTLKDFQYIDRDGKDQGVNVREKSKQLVSLLKDEERLKQERAYALKTKERMSGVATGISSSQQLAYGVRSSQPTVSSAEEYGRSRESPTSLNSSSSSPQLASDLEQARPQTSGEEELQLQLALAMSREEAEKEPLPSVTDDEEIQLQLALSLSKEEHEKEVLSRQGENSLLQKVLEENEVDQDKNQSSLGELVDVFAPMPAGVPSADPWEATTNGASSQSDHWRSDQNASPSPLRPFDPWDSSSAKPSVPAANASWPDSVSTHPWHADPWGSEPTAIPPSSVTSWSTSASPSHLPADSWDPASSTPCQPNTDIWGKSSADPWMTIADSKSSTETGGSSFGFAKLPDILEEDLVNDGTRPPSVKSSSPADFDYMGELVPSTKENGTKSPDMFDLAELEGVLPDTSAKSTRDCRTPESFLGPSAASLVNLDSLVTAPSQSVNTKNPFLLGLSSPSPTNPFQMSDQPKLTLNQMRTTSLTPQPSLPSSIPLETPLASMSYSASLPMPLSSLPAAMNLPSSISDLPSTNSAAQYDTGIRMEMPNLPQPLLPVSSSVSPPQALDSPNPFL